MRAPFERKEGSWFEAGALSNKYGNLLTGYEQLSYYQFNRNLSSCVFYKQKVHSYYIKSSIKTY